MIFGLLYFLVTPSMQMLLIIYSIANLNNVSWGTRESPNRSQHSEGTSDNGKRIHVHSINKYFFQSRLSLSVICNLALRAIICKQLYYFCKNIIHVVLTFSGTLASVLGFFR